MADSVGVPLSSALEEALGFVSAQNRKSGRDPNAKGVHASLPFMTPKYARWMQHRHHEFEDTMARMFIQVPAVDYQKFLDSLEDPQTAMIAQYLSGDNDGGGGVGYIDFFLQSAKHQFVEKVQVTEVLSDNYVAFFFGHAAPVFSYSGTLMNTYQDDWTMRMFRIFRDLGRGTQLARRGQILRLRYDSMIVSGAMTNFSWNLEAGLETFCPFSFDLLVKNVSIIYGGNALPTKVADMFTPAWAHLEDSSFGTESSASQMYIGAPPQSPGGVSNTEVDTTYTNAEVGEEVQTMPQVTPPAGAGIDVDL
jgi:hypothetical protein